MRANAQPAPNGFAARESALAFRRQGSGQPVVFLHGVGLNKNAWRKQEEFFAAARRTTIVCDLPGHGPSHPSHSHPSSHPASQPPRPARLSDYSAPVAALLDELGFERADIVGHSFGGLVALDFALRFPQKIRRLAALNCVFRRPPAAKKAALDRARALANGGAPQVSENAVRRWFGHPPAAENAALAEEARQWLRAANPEGFARAYQLFAECDADFAPQLHRLAAPALFATGENDPHSTPEMSREMAEIAPKGQCVILPGQRHMAALSAPDIVNPVLLKFLSPQ